MPLQQTQGVQIKGRDEAAFATLTQDVAKQRLDVSVQTNADGEVVVRNLIADIKWDKILPAPTATEDVYIFSFDGTTTTTITIYYTDASKETVSPVNGITKVVV